MKILPLMKRLGYTINEGGMCYGIAFMAIQAIIRNDINTYVNRLRFINGYDDKLRNYQVINLNPLPKHHELDTIYINPTNKKYSFRYNKEGINEFISGTIPAEIANEINSISLPLIIPNKEELKKLKAFFAIELLAKHIEKAEVSRAKNITSPEQHKLLNIKPWLDGVTVYHGLKSPKDLSVEEEAVWNKNFNTWDGDNKPFTHQDYNRGVKLFKNLNNKSQVSFIDSQQNKANLKYNNSELNFDPNKDAKKQKDNSIYLLQKHVGIYNKKNIGEIINFLNNNPSTPIACSLSRSGHTIAIGNSKKMGYHLIDHDRYKKSINLDSLHQDVMKHLFREESYDPKREYAISILVFGAEKPQGNLVPKNTFGLTEGEYWKFLMSNTNMSSDAGLLHLALQDGHAEAVENYIKAIEKVNINNTDKQKLLAAKDPAGVSGLFMALQKGHAAAVKSYIEAVININGINKQELLAAKNSNGAPGFFMALQKGHAAAVENYIKAIANINGINKQELLAAKNSNGGPGLFMALQDGHAEAVENYIKAIANINDINKQELLAAKNPNGAPGLFMALQKGHAAAVENYIKAIANINGINKQELLAAKNSEGVPGFYAVLYNGNTEAVKSYIEAVININGVNKQELLAAKNSNGGPGLYAALYNGNTEAVKSYIEAAININGINKQELLAAKNSEGVPGLYVALYNGNTEAVKSYIEAVININGVNKQELLAAKNSNGAPGFYAVLYKGNTEAVKSYIEAVININGVNKQELLAAKNSNGGPGLFMALQNGHADTIAVYLKINDNDNSYADYIMQEYKTNHKSLKNQLLAWAGNYKPEMKKDKDSYKLLVTLLSFNRGFINKNTTKSMKALNNILHWQ
ncbi:ankyrin repeat domain-containing protein [Allofrancisella inopinata]|uniref:Ankyrin repeat domain-containing protein n=1 Tax=Allofrancisella inopinata TaxID=1085647 RepID=A0AAE6YIB1_9GAMM|nr:ankyrin repeat domain-containing protein [Allofrancisella inopinata]QIV96278.1 ankyrin repeat domain-containing protein [Allofrancisella inopinata]